MLVLLAAGALLAGACGGDDQEAADDGDDGGLAADTATTNGPSDGGTDDVAGSGGTSPGAAALDDLDLQLTEVAAAESPTSLVTRPGTGGLYVAERAGTVRALAIAGSGADRTYELADEPLIDISDDVVADGERGLLDIEWAEDGAVLYLSYSLAPGGDTRVDAYDVDDDVLDTGSRREILAVDQPFANHNGGDIEFGPDGYLYVALGDGGSGGDPRGNGQDTGALLGKILRLDPAAPAGGRAYGIPADNPFADGGGAPEVWLYGVRNPWRIAFDPGSGDLWVADVGQNAWEEIDMLPAADGGGRGANLGWNAREGAHDYGGGSAPEGAIEPVYEYSHDEGCSITGGVVVDGGGVPGLEGAYVFSDYCEGVLRAVRVSDGEVVDERVFDDVTINSPVSFGVDAGGDVYVLSLGGTIARIDPA
ncbi:MAG TPA: PQQ-dependent sugar dehydrogenase [Acidimicrobiales bacterium]|nr:PQQ-dependent sugar dehydrogenase [Acidimicrobiales bacterium]